MDGPGRVLGVVGARGGVGATTVAAALAQRLAGARASRDRGHGRPEVVALVDLDGDGAGLDVHLGIEAVDGLRWPDLHDARGEVSGADVAALLPTWGDAVVLSGDRWRPGPPPAEVVADVLAALGEAHDVVVVDLGRREVREAGPGLRRCDTVLVVCGRDVGSVAGVVALRGALRDAVPDVRLAVGGPGPGRLGALEVAHVVDLPVAATLPVDRRLPALVDRGLGPALRGRGSWARVVSRLARDLG